MQAYFATFSTQKPSMQPEPKMFANYLCMYYRKISFVSLEAYLSHGRGMILELLLFVISNVNSLSAQNRFLFCGFTVTSHLFISNILDFPTGEVLFTRARFLCTSVKLAGHGQKRRKPNIIPAPVSMVTVWNEAMVNLPHQLTCMSLCHRFSTVSFELISVWSQVEGARQCYEQGQSALWVREARGTIRGWCCFHDVMQIWDERRRSVTIIITL